MDNKKGFVPLIALLMAVIIMGSLLIGYVIGRSHVATAAVVRTSVAYSNHTYVLDSIDTCVLPIYTASNSYVWKPTIGDMGWVPISTIVLYDDDADENSNHDIVVTEVPTMTTITITPPPTVTPVPTITQTPAPTSTPAPTEKPDDGKSNCNNGVGNGPDCPPPGHDKDGDGVSDDSKGDNDDDAGVKPCGDPGNPCNKKANQGSVFGFIALLIVNALNWIRDMRIKWAIRFLNDRGFAVHVVPEKYKWTMHDCHPMLCHLCKKGLMLGPACEESCTAYDEARGYKIEDGTGLISKKALIAIEASSKHPFVYQEVEKAMNDTWKRISEKFTEVPFRKWNSKS